MGKHDWKMRDSSDLESNKLSKSLGISLYTAQLLINRGIQSPDDAHQFLFGTLKDLPHPKLIPGMEKGVERIRQALSQKEKIFLFGDYDVDGVTGTVILSLFLESQGADVTAILPNRFTDGYGVTPAIVDRVHEERKGKKTLLVTVDNGTKATEAIAKANEYGIDVVVLDHHETPEGDNGAHATINPKITKDNPLPLCSAGLAFYVVVSLRSSLKSSGVYTGEAITPYLDFAALGTIADVVPLVGVNRLLVKEGLKGVSNSTWLGLRSLIDEAGVGGDISAGQVGFRLAPRLNAAGRLEHAKLAFDLLASKDEHKAKQLAGVLGEMNTKRQREEEQILIDVEALMSEQNPIPKHGVCLAKEGWHEGVLGIVAARITDRYFRPALALAINGDTVKGSGRSIPGFNLHACVQKCESYLGRWGGHQAAIGLSLDVKNLEPFKAAFEKESKMMLAGFSDKPSLKIDTALPFSKVTPTLMKELESLAPFGFGNPEPIFSAEKIIQVRSRIVGTNHLKMTLSDNGTTLNAIHFRYGETPPTTKYVSVAFYPEWNEWNGERTIQLRVKDLKLNG